MLYYWYYMLVLLTHDCTCLCTVSKELLLFNYTSNCIIKVVYVLSSKLLVGIIICYNACASICVTFLQPLHLAEQDSRRTHHPASLWRYPNNYSGKYFSLIYSHIQTFLKGYPLIPKMPNGVPAGTRWHHCHQSTEAIAIYLCIMFCVYHQEK